MFAYSMDIYTPDIEDILCKLLIDKNFITPFTSIVCIGTNDCLEDLLGPLTGTLLREQKKDLSMRVYGTLASPLNALNIKSKLPHILKKEEHILSIDSIISFKEDVGKILLKDSGIKAGEGVGINLPYIGHCSIVYSISDKLQYTLMKEKVNFKKIYDCSKILCSSIIKAKTLIT